MQPFEFKRYIPIEKLDDEERMVYGYATTPTLDSDGEIITQQAIKNALPAYLQFPTLREMHQPKVAGTVKSTELKTDGKEGLYIGAKVVSDEAWKMVKEGAYRGFSIGGHVVNREGNIINAIDLVEISLVDVPANKQAKIEVWKREKVTKDAETAWSLSNLAITLKETINYYEFLGKDVKKLIKALELVKEALVVEASETEKESQARMQDMFLSDNSTDLRKAIDSIDRITFTNNPVAELLRKAVKMNMQEKLEKQDSVLEPEVEVAEPVEVKEENQEDLTEKEEVKEEVKEQPEAVVEEQPAEEVKETSEDTTLNKLDSINKVLESVVKAEEKKVEEKVEINKSINGIVDSLTKAVDLISKLNARVEALEQLPAPTKSKATYLVSREDVSKAESAVVEKPELAKLQTRKSELLKILEQIGANEFAKQGFSKEAGDIQSKIEGLSK